MEAAIDEVADSASGTPLELSGDPTELSAPAISEATAAKLEKLDKQLGLTPCLILSVSENGYGKRTDVDQYRLQSRGGKGVINMKATPKIGKVSAINLVDETSELMVISQFGKIIRIDTKCVRAAGRSTSGVKLLDLDSAGQSGRRRRHSAGRSEDATGRGNAFAVVFSGAGVTPFLLGVLAKTGCRTWFFAGEFVVDCW